MLYLLYNPIVFISELAGKGSRVWTSDWLEFDDQGLTIVSSLSLVMKLVELKVCSRRGSSEHDRNRPNHPTHTHTGLGRYADDGEGLS